MQKSMPLNKFCVLNIVLVNIFRYKSFSLKDMYLSFKSNIKADNFMGDYCLRILYMWKGITLHFSCWGSDGGDIGVVRTKIWSDTMLFF